MDVVWREVAPAHQHQCANKYVIIKCFGKISQFMQRKSDVEIPHILLSAYTPTDFIANTLRASRSVGVCVWVLCGGGGGGGSARSTIYSIITMNLSKYPGEQWARTK